MSKLEQAILAAGTSLQSTDEGFKKAFVFSEYFIGFDGHFPDNPILPAVVQLMAGAITAAEAAGLPLSAHGISRAKFVRPIAPDETLLVAGRLKSKGEQSLAAMTIHVGEELAASFTVTLSKEEQ